MNKLIIFLLLPFASFAQSEGKEFKLKGELKPSKPIDWIYLHRSAGGQWVSDSVQSKTGEFKFEGKLAEPTLATLVVKYEKNPDGGSPRSESIQIFLEPTKMEIKAKDSLKSNTVTGSSGHNDFISISKKQEPLTKKLRELYQEYSRLKRLGATDSLKLIEAEVETLQDKINQHYGEFAKSNPQSNYSLTAVKNFAGWDIDVDKVDPLFNSLPEATKKWPSAEKFKETMEIARKTSVGKYAMEFTQNDTSGNPVSLASFKGKYVLVDFWASWCGPCRAENPNIVKYHKKYQNKNFTVLGVSLDRPNAKDKWLKAIYDDQLAWTHVSDLKFWQNEVAQQYGIQAIPQNFLLDPQGKIIAKNIKGEELDKKLGEVLK